MGKSKISIAIPTRNRANFLKRSIECVLVQTYKDFELLIIDNNSSDSTREVVKSFDDKRINYIKNPKNIGIIGNWNQCIKYSKGEYLNIFHDDDIMYETFIEESVKVLDKYSTVGFTFPLLKRVDVKRNFLNMWWEDYNKKKLLIKGIDYILMTIEKERCISLAPSMVFRKSIFERLGPFKQVYGFNTFDFNMWFKIAEKYDVYHINKILFEYTIHKNQMSQRHWRAPESPTGPIGMSIEIIDSIARLVDSSIVDKKKYRKLLSVKLLNLNMKLTRDITIVIKDL